MRILVVDDEPLVLDTIVPFLGRCGHQALALATVAEAAAALEAGQEAVDLVIADVRLAEGDAAQLTQLSRTHRPALHVILMSGQTQAHDLRRALDAGVAGFLRKPVKLDELRLLVEHVATLRAERARLDVMTLRLDAERGLRETATRERMVARGLHRRIFPSDLSWLRGAEVAIRHLPKDGMGGDFMDLRPYGHGRALLLIADVSGQGTPAAFGGIALKAWFGALEAGLSPVEVLARADHLIGGLFPEDAAATAFCALYDEHGGTLAYASAGHPRALVIGAT
ncbi:MAG: response regulator, partial [Planctomycetes bacterium]|nr:response regulator [Planctomycetota bacterium]